MNTHLLEGTRNSPVRETLLNEKEASLLLNIGVKTLQYWRVAGGGPAFVKLGRLVRYELSSLQSFIEGNRKTNTCDNGGSHV